MSRVPGVSGWVVGIDASGPANHDDTALCALDVSGGEVRCLRHARGLGDRAIVDLVAELPGDGPVVVGIDAPLSYGERGGDRPGDRHLRQSLRAAGLATSSVLAPTAPRMAYLTLRGMGMARALQLGLRAPPRLIEVHPGAALALAGAPFEHVRRVKSDLTARRAVLAWLGASILGLPDELADCDHQVMAAAAAWAAWRWTRGQASWTWPADPPLHPFPYVC